MNFMRRAWRYSRALLFGKIDNFSSPLQTAAFNGDIKTMTTLLDLGIDINAGEPAPIDLAIIGGRANAVRLLIKRGARLDKRGLQEALALAEMKGNKEIVDLLAAQGIRRYPNIDWNS